MDSDLDIKKVKTDLLGKRDEITARVERTHKHLFARDEPVSANFSEQVKQRENDELIQALDQEGREELRMINKALARIESGDYPFCSRCGEEIAPQRLQAIPYTDKCIACASAIAS